MNGDQNSILDRSFGAPKYKGSDGQLRHSPILVNDLNDAPRAGAVGNWWITVDDDRFEEAENSGCEGDLLSVDPGRPRARPVTLSRPSGTTILRRATA